MVLAMAVVVFVRAEMEELRLSYAQMQNTDTAWIDEQKNDSWDDR